MGGLFFSVSFSFFSGVYGMFPISLRLLWWNHKSSETKNLSNFTLLLHSCSISLKWAFQTCSKHQYFCHKYKSRSQEDSSFPADSHSGPCYISSRSLMNTVNLDWMSFDLYNSFLTCQRQTQHWFSFSRLLILSKLSKSQTINKIGEVGLNRFYALALGSAVVHKQTKCSIRVKDFYSSMHHNSQHINQESTPKWNKTSIQQQDPYWKTGATEIQQLNNLKKRSFGNMYPMFENSRFG